MYIKKVYKIIHWVLVFGGVVSQYKPVEGFCFYVVVVVLGGIFVSWQKGEINFFFPWTTWLKIQVYEQVWKAVHENYE